MATSVVGHEAHGVAPAHGETTGLWSWITTVDHKRIGILYGATAFLFFLLGGLEALLHPHAAGAAGQQLRVAGDLQPAVHDARHDHDLPGGHAAVVRCSSTIWSRCMIGARDVAFPRLNAFSYWVFLLGGLFLNASWLFGAAPERGLVRLRQPDLEAVLARASTSISGSWACRSWASLRWPRAVNFFVTIVNLRAPGMRLMRMPMFVWMSFITQVLLLLAFPVITVALIMLMFDRLFGTHFFVPAGGGDPMLWQHLFWIFGHPEVYILILPAFGIVSEVLPVFSRKPLFGYAAMVFSGVFIAFLGFGVWSHHMFATGMGPIADTFFSLATMLIAIPTGVKIFNWIGTIWGGSLQLQDPDALRARLHRDVHHGRALRRHARLAAGRPAADRHLLRGGPLPLRAVRREHLRAHRRRLLLVAEDVRPDARREAGQAPFLADAHRLQPDVLPDALRRAARHAPPGLHLPRAASASSG